ncbi:hypothetical protein [Shewanella sp.]
MQIFEIVDFGACAAGTQLNKWNKVIEATKNEVMEIISLKNVIL